MVIQVSVSRWFDPDETVLEGVSGEFVDEDDVAALDHGSAVELRQCREEDPRVHAGEFVHRTGQFGVGRCGRRAGIIQANRDDHRGQVWTVDEEAVDDRLEVGEMESREVDVGDAVVVDRPVAGIVVPDDHDLDRQAEGFAVETESAGPSRCP